MRRSEPIPWRSCSTWLTWHLPFLTLEAVTVKDLTGKKFNRLTVLGFERKDANSVNFWRCMCDCGNETVVRGYSLESGGTKSCGCLKREKAKPPMIIKHGMSDTRLYQCWKDMKGRCNRPTSARYYTHGARGITVCEEWLSFEPFYEWAMENGYQDNLTLDRIDNDGNYEPSNCRWVTMEVQGNNRRTNRLVEYGGEEMTISELSKKTGVLNATLRSRLNRGASIETATYQKTYKKGEMKNGLDF